MISRAIHEHARFALTQFRALCITGPRQSGKTTLARALVRGKPYVNFEDPATEARFLEDPAEFMKSFKGGAIFDEVQRVPDVFRYLQVFLDRNTSRGQFILTGSNNFLLQQQVSQSLAGRAGYLSLLPFSYDELRSAKRPVDDLHKLILTGGYPEIWAKSLRRSLWMQSYIQTYLQRDVRQLRNISDLSSFIRLLGLCANHAGQPVNKDELASDVGVDAKTIQAWLALLESSYIIFLLQPWHRNLNKRIVKTPKLYFYDTGLLCSLLKIDTKDALMKHPLYGFIFENWCISEVKKNRFNAAEDAGLFFYRDHLGNEIDLIMEKSAGPVAVEIKSARKRDKAQLAGLKYWRKYRPADPGLLLYQGTDSDTEDPATHYFSWKGIDEL